MEIAAILTTLIPSLIPTVIDVVKGLFGKITGVNPAAPKSPDDTLKLYNAETERLKVLSQIGTPYGEVSRWVNNLRGSCQYVAVLFIIGSTVIYNFFPEAWYSPDTDVYMRQLCGSALFFLLGARVNLAANHKK